EHAVRRDDSNLVVGVDIAQFWEERVAVAGKPEVSGIAWERRARDVPNRQTQRARVASGSDHGRDPETRNLDASNLTAGCEGASRHSTGGRSDALACRP